MIDFSKEPPLSWRDALQEPELRTKRNSPHSSRWWKLTKLGIKGVDGTLVKLEMVRLPHGPATSRAAILRFISRINGVTPIEPQRAVGETNDAMRELAAAGFAVA